MCGIVGIVSTEPVNQQIYDALLLLQHRGQDSTGIATSDGSHLHQFKTKGQVREAFPALDLAQAGQWRRTGEERAGFRDVTGYRAALDEAAARLGPARILVNCAGIGPSARISGRDGPHDLALFRKVVEVNLVGTFNMMRLAAARMQDLPALEDGERGVVVMTASVAAFEGQVGQAAYAASKGGVAALTLPAARELARAGIRVATIAPGTFDTPMLATVSQDVRDSLARQVPFPPRLGRPEEYGSLVRFICENPLLNGETVRLDGAIRMGPR
jgi:NAD(P)-dependent dehydrogenase (short-subunit alcohol dehydrogenase family)